MFLEYKELIKTPEFWLETIQNDLYSEVKTFMTENNLTQTQLAEQLGVSKGYISQILKGKFNHTLKKLIEISLAIGKVPSIEFKSSKEWMRSKAEVKEYTYIEVIMTGSLDELIIKAVCGAYDTTYEQINCKCRRRELCECRQVIMALLYMSGKFSLFKVGLKFKRDHATVSHAVKTVKNLWDSSFDFRAKVIPILKKLNLPDDHFEKVYVKKIAPKTKKA